MSDQHDADRTAALERRVAQLERNLIDLAKIVQEMPDAR
jgi:hypothetical protein